MDGWRGSLSKRLEAAKKRTEALCQDVAKVLLVALLDERQMLWWSSRLVACPIGAREREGRR